MATVSKVYSISIELDQARKDLADAGKLLDALKTKTAAANQEVRETKEVYQLNSAALKGLVQEQKALDAARKAAPAGAGALAAQAALEANAAAQAKLNGILQESKIDYDNAKQAAADAGKAAAAQTATVRELAASVQGYGAAAAAAEQSFDPGTVGALRAEVEALEAAFDRTTVGTREQDAALLELGKKKGELKALDDAVDALDPKMKAAAFLDFSNGVVGAFTVATTAATTFGLSQETADKYQQKLLSLISVMSGVEQISKALNSETLSVVKSTYAAAKGWLGVGEAATTSGKLTRTALLSTGIGVLIVAIGLLVANFEKVKAVASEIYQKFKPEFDAVGALIDTVAGKARDLAHFLTFGLVDDAAKHAQAVAQEAAQKQLASEAEKTARYIDILKARGDDTLKLEVENARKRAASLAALDKDATAEQKKAADDATRDYLVLKLQLEKRSNDEVKAERLAGLNATAAAEAALGKATFAQQLAAKKEQIAQLNEAEKAGQLVTAAQRTQLAGELAAIENAQAKAQDDKRRALLSARLQGQLAVLTAQGGDEYQLQVKQNALQLKLAQQHLKDVQQAAQPDAAAILTAQKAIDVLRIQQADIFYKEREKQEAAHQATIQSEIEGPYVRGLIREKKYQADLALVRAGAARVNEQLAAEQAERLRLAVLRAEQNPGDTLLVRLFGLNEGQLNTLKGRLTDFVVQASGLVNSLLSIAQQTADERLSETQSRLDAVIQQLSDVQGRIASDESALENARGAKRDYLLQKINNERAAEEKLATAKSKAAADEAAAEREKQKLTKESTQLTLAAGLASTVATGAKSVEAAVGVIKGGSDLPFPANVVAIAAGLAVVTGAIAQARALNKTFANGTGALGEDGVLAGQTHAQGGIQLYGKDGTYYGEAEDGEAITPADASAKNAKALQLIRTAGRTRVLTPADFAQIANVEVKAPPVGHFANGTGGLGRGAVPAGSVAVSSADLSSLLATNQQMAAYLQAVAAHTGTVAGFGPPVLEFGHEAEIKRQELTQGMSEAKAGASL